MKETRLVVTDAIKSQTDFEMSCPDRIFCGGFWGDTDSMMFGWCWRRADGQWGHVTRLRNPRQWHWTVMRGGIRENNVLWIKILSTIVTLFDVLTGSICWSDQQVFLLSLSFSRVSLNLAADVQVYRRAGIKTHKRVNDSPSPPSEYDRCDVST